MKKLLGIFIKIVLCVLASVGGFLTLNYSKIVSLLVFFAYITISLIGNRDNKRVRVVSLIFGFLYTLILIIGGAIYNTGVIDTLYCDSLATIDTIISVVGITYMMYIINYYVFAILEKYEVKSKESKILNKDYRFLYVWLIIFLLWLPCFLSYYPGIYSYDVTKQVNEVFSLNYTKFHPPIHTGIIAICFHIANYLNVEMIVVYSLIQMLFFSYACMKLLKFIYLKTKNKWLFLISFLFLVINPVMAIISLLPTKDVYFAGFLLLLIPDIYDLIYNQDEFLSSKFNIFKIILFSLLAMLFRNNASYVFIIFYVIMLILYRKNKKMIFICLLPIVLFIGVNNVLYPNIYVKEGNSREKLSLPMMQISYVVSKNEENLSEDDLKWVNKYIPLSRIRSRFNPRFADPIKSKFKTDKYDSHPTDFYKLYFHLLLKYPNDYLSELLNLNIPYWYQKAQTLDVYSERAYIETGIYENHNYIFERESKLPRLYDFYEKFATYEIQQKYYILDLIYNIHLPIWLLLFSVFIIILKKNYRSILVILPLILLWLTYLLGPVSNFRYIIPIYVLYPMIIYLLLKKKDNAS